MDNLEEKSWGEVCMGCGNAPTKLGEVFESGYCPSCPVPNDVIEEPIPNPPGACLSCPCWRRIPESDRELGECKRNPPNRFAPGHYSGDVMTAAPRWEYPVTHEEDWCFEHPENRAIFLARTGDVQEALFQQRDEQNEMLRQQVQKAEDVLKRFEGQPPSRATVVFPQQAVAHE